MTLAAAPHATHLPVWIPAVGSAVFLWRLFLGWRGLALPPRWLLFTLAGLGNFSPFNGAMSGVAR